MRAIGFDKAVEDLSAAAAQGTFSRRNVHSSTYALLPRRPGECSEGQG